MPQAAVRPSSRHRFLVVLATLIVLLLGFFALGRLPIDLLPAPEVPHLLVRVSVPGVSASVDLEGGAVREILVMPDQRRLAGYGLSFGDLLQAIRKGPAADTPVRRPPTKSRGRHVAMQSGGAAAVAALPVILRGGESISLSEIATVTLGEGARPGPFRFDGREAVKITVHRQPRVVMADVVERIQAHGEWMRANRLIPEDIEIHPLSQRLVQARHSLGRIAWALVAGVALALFTAQLLLGRGRRGVMPGGVNAAPVQAG